MSEVIERSVIKENINKIYTQQRILDITKLNIENISKIVQFSIEEHLSDHQEKNLSCQVNSIKSMDNELSHLETNSSIDQQIEIRQDQQQDILLKNHIDKQDNQFIKDSSENKQEKSSLLTIEKKILKKKRRRSQKSILTSKRRKQKQLKSMKNNEIQWWINKYSIEPISIYLHRVNKPTN